MGQGIMLSLEHSNAGQLVTKQNNLITSAYRLTLQEQRLLYVMISMINKEDEDFQDYIIDLKEFSKIVGYKGKSFYSEAQSITRKLESRVIEIADIEKGTLLQIGWISSAEYVEKKGYVKICFDPKLKPYLLQIKGSYTQFTLLNILKLRSVYAVRIYELLKQYEGWQKERKFLLEALRKILGINDKEYKLFGDFKRKVLDRAKNEINKETDLHIDYQTIKVGRKVEAVVFLINPSKNKQEQITLDEIPNKALYNRLVNKFQQSPKQAKSYLQNYPSSQIEQNLKIIEIKYRSGDVNNLGAFTHKAITENYYGQSTLFDNPYYQEVVKAKEKKEKEEAQKKAQQEQAELEKLEQEYRDYYESVVEKQLELLSAEEKAKLEEEASHKAKEEYGYNKITHKKMTEITLSRIVFNLAGGLSFEDWKLNKQL